MYNKLIVSVIATGVIIANTFFNVEWAIDEATINTVAGIIGTILVYLIPNTPAPTPEEPTT